MNTHTSIPSALLDDDALVAASLDSDCAAFTRIVERHQNLVCAVAYVVTGDRSASEDIGQETFLHAWKNLAQLRDPARLRPWLAGIARNLAHNHLRRGGRDVLHDSAPLDPERSAEAGSPAEVAVGVEEEQLVWSALAQLPAEYREPLVLFYREHQSIEHVAVALELSEDAVKQRLSRGRRQLQERVLARVETTLRRTTVGAAFTVAVATALPLALPAPAVAATAGIAGTAATGPIAGIALVGATTGAALGAVLGVLGAVVGGGLGLLGGLLGTRAALRTCATPAERSLVLRFAWLFSFYALAFAGGVSAVILQVSPLRQVAPWLPLGLLVGGSLAYVAGLFAMVFRLNARFQALRAARRPPA